MDNQQVAESSKQPAPMIRTQRPADLRIPASYLTNPVSIPMSNHRRMSNTEKESAATRRKMPPTTKVTDPIPEESRPKKRSNNHLETDGLPITADWNPRRMKKQRRTQPHHHQKDSPERSKAPRNERQWRCSCKHDASKPAWFSTHEENDPDTFFAIPLYGAAATTAAHSIAKFTLKPSVDGKPVIGSLLWHQEHYRERLISLYEDKMKEGEAVEERKRLSQHEPDFKTTVLDPIIVRNPRFYGSWLRSTNSRAAFNQPQWITWSWEDWCYWIAPTVYESTLWSADFATRK